MNTKNILGTLAITSLVATSLAFAQDANVSGSASINVNAGIQDGMPPPPANGKGGPGMMGRLRNMGKDFQQEMQEGKKWMASDTGATASGTTWRGMMRGDMQNLRADMQGMMASITANLTADQKAAISAKLGITLEELQAKITAGTPLPQIIGNKITKEDMMKIMPMMMHASGSASTSMGMMHDRGYGNDDRDQKPQGFLKTFFGKIFSGKSGDGEAMPKESMEMHNGMMMNASGSMQVDANASADVHPDGPIGGIRNFFKRLFNF